MNFRGLNSGLSVLFDVHPVNPQKRILQEIAEGLNAGKIYILPTDTVYAFAATFRHKSAIEKLYRLKEIPPTKPLSLYCKDMSQAARFVRMEDNRIFRSIRSSIPGPFTFILRASKELPHFSLNKQKTVGIRIIDHPVIRDLLELTEFPIIGTSVFKEENYITWADDLDEIYGNQVEGIVDCGPCENGLSTIIDCRDFPVQILRQGIGDFHG